MEDHHRITKRGKSFTSEEDVAICNSWACIGQDPIIGNSQQSDTFWARVTENYVTTTGDNSRTPASLRSRWNTIKGCCSKYRGWLTQVEHLHQSGVTQADQVVQAKVLYHDNEGKHFIFDRCWAIIQNCIKWQDVPNTTKKSRTRTTANDSSPPSPIGFGISDNNISLDSDHSPFEMSVDSPREKRPSGRKKEKESRRKSKIAEGENSKFIDLMEQFNKNAEEQKITQAKKTELEERRVKVMEEMNAREEREKDEAIMNMDLSNMEPIKKAYYELRQQQIMDKIMSQSQAGSSNYFNLPDY